MESINLSNKEVLAIPPVNAWLLMADRASEPSPKDIRDRSIMIDPAGIWTGRPHARVGDLLFFYFMSPDKAVRYVARAASDPFFDSEIDVNTLGTVSSSQWWIEHTPLVPVPEVSFQELVAMHNGHLILRGQSGKYLSPNVVRESLGLMLERARPRARSEISSVVKVPLGDPNLPADPASITRKQWSAIADGALKLEAQVEDSIVAPLLRFALGSDVTLSVQPQFPSKRGRADWGVIRDGLPTGVIETKLGVGEPGGADNWMDSPAFAQLRRYMDIHDVPGVLIDTRRIMLVNPKGERPKQIIDRRTMTDADLAAIGTHLGAKVS